MRRPLGAIIAIVILGTAVAASWSIRIPVLVIAGGPLVDVATVVTIPGDDGAAGDGITRWLLPTVAARPATIGDIILAGLRPDTELVAYSRLVPEGQDLAAFMEANEALMRESQLMAAYVAYRWSGRQAVISGEGARVLGVWPHTAASAAGLEAGDVVVEAGGRTIRLADDLRDVLANRTQPVDLTIQRGGQLQKVTVPQADPIPGSGDGDQFPDGGMLLVTENLAVDFEPGIDFNENDVAGPSGGLAFGLYIADRLAGLGLPPDATVVATGTLQADGTVRPVGGLSQKLQAVAAAGLDVMVIPGDNAGQVDDRARIAGRPDVLSAASFDEAVQRLTAYFDRRYNDSVPGGGSFENQHR